MKKTISTILMLAIMLTPVCSNAMGMKERRNIATAAPESDSASDDFSLSGLSTEDLYMLYILIEEELYSRGAGYLIESDSTESVPYASEEGYVLIDRNGVRLTLTGSSFDNDSCALYFDTIVENRNDYRISIGLETVYIDGVEVNGLGIYKVDTGAQTDYFFLEPKAMSTGMYYLFEYANEISIVFNVYDGDTYEDLFKQEITLYAY